MAASRPFAAATPGLRSPLALALFVSAGVFLLGLAVQTIALPGVFLDDGIYVLLGKAIASGHGLHYLGVPGEPPAAKYPPLFPLLLAGVWRLRPELPQAIAGFRLLNLLLATAGAGAFTYYLLRGLRLPTFFAVAIAACAWITVDTWRYAVIPLSEPLFTLCLAGVLGAAIRLERGDSRGGDILLFLGAFALAYYARTVGFTIAAAVVLAAASRRRFSQAALLAAGAVIIALPWTLWARRAAEALPASMADMLGPYTGWLTGQLLAHPGTFLVQFAARILPLGERVLATVLPGAPAVVLWVLAPVALGVSAVGMAELWRRSRTAALILPLFLATLWLWPFVGRRLLAPIAPWLILVFGLGLRAAWLSRTDWLRRAGMAVTLVWGLWFAGVSASNLLQHRYDQPLLVRSSEMATAVQAIQTAVPAGAVVGSAEMWAGIGLLSGHPAAPSIRFRTVSSGRAWGDPAEQYRLWQDARIRYLWVHQGTPLEGEALQGMARVCGAAAWRVVATSPAGVLVALEATPACYLQLDVGSRRAE